METFVHISRTIFCLGLVAGLANYLWRNHVDRRAARDNRIRAEALAELELLDGSHLLVTNLGDRPAIVRIGVDRYQTIRPGEEVNVPPNAASFQHQGYHRWARRTIESL